MDNHSPKMLDFPEITAATTHLAKMVCEHTKGGVVVGTILIPTDDGFTSIRFGTAETLDEWMKLFHMAHAEAHIDSKPTDQRLVDLKG